MVHNFEQDFADRHYKWFGGRKNFGYLVKMAKEYGVSRCEQIIGEMKREFGFDGKPVDSRIKWFHKVCNHKQAKGRNKGCG